jgi:hypothetical protein
MPRYKVIEDSQSGHCCFEATVVDTHSPVMMHGEHYKGRYHAVCECMDEDDAQMIADALNKASA